MAAIIYCINISHLPYFLKIDLTPRYIKYPTTIDAIVTQVSCIFASLFLLSWRILYIFSSPIKHLLNQCLATRDKFTTPNTARTAIATFAFKKNQTSQRVYYINASISISFDPYSLKLVGAYYTLSPARQYLFPINVSRRKTSHHASVAGSQTHLNNFSQHMGSSIKNAAKNHLGQ